MALINHAKREINAKIVYYGPEGSGKRSSLQYIYDRIKPSLRGNLQSPAASGDSLFFFDFSPFEGPVFGNYRIRFHVYTLPGKVSNPAAWKMTLKSADGLVIVADAAPEFVIAARESISLLRGFLASYGVGFQDIPCVLQLNCGNTSQDLTLAGMASSLDLPDIQACHSRPLSGEGVLETLSLLSREIMIRIGRDDALQLLGSAVTPEVGVDSEGSAALSSPANKSDDSLNKTIQVLEEKSTLQLLVTDSAESLKVVLAGEGAVCSEGVVRVPLEFTLGGEKRRLVVSIAIDQD